MKRKKKKRVDGKKAKSIVVFSGCEMHTNRPMTKFPSYTSIIQGTLQKYERSNTVYLNVK